MLPATSVLVVMVALLVLLALRLPCGPATPLLLATLLAPPPPPLPLLLLALPPLALPLRLCRLKVGYLSGGTTKIRYAC